MTKINHRVWVHTTYEKINGNKVPANRLVINTSKGIVLVDAAWNEQLARELIDMIEEEFHKPIILAIVTHHKLDRIGGIEALKEEGIEVRSTPLIAEMVKKSGYPEPSPTLDAKETTIEVGNTRLKTFYSGEEHTNDNITVWLPQYHILFSDMIFALEQQGPGIIDEANMQGWPKTMEAIMNKYPDPLVVIPGHKDGGDESLLTHTVEVLNQYLESHK